MSDRVVVGEIGASERSVVERYGAGDPAPNVVDADSFSSTITNTWPIGGVAALADELRAVEAAASTALARWEALAEVGELS